jgi:hypothetical protein
VHAGDCARQAMDLMYRHGASTPFKAGSRLAEVWRDLQAVGQAATLAPEYYPIGVARFSASILGAVAVGVRSIAPRASAMGINASSTFYRRVCYPKPSCQRARRIAG